MKKPKQFSLPRGTGKKFTLESGSTGGGRAKGYDADWERYRWRFLHHNPICYVCGKKSTVCDHIKSFKGDMELFRNTSNHMPLCTVCHNTITGLFDRVAVPDVEAKVAWINERRKFNNVTVSIKVLAEYIKKK